ncbi:MAG: glycerol acyltransferase [Phycisphaerae bacterium]|nr:glycerol acyltransferase [Phycisphaerae bacterium]
MTEDHLGPDDGGVTRNDDDQGELKLTNPFRDPVRRRMASMALPAISRMLRVGALNKIVQDSLAYLPDMNGPDAILRTMGAQYEVSEADLARIPKEGPCVVVANHPFGGIEGLALMSLVLRARPDAKTLGNRILGTIPSLREHLLLVDVLGGDPTANTRSMRATLGHLRKGGLLAVFPAGEVSHARLTRPFVADPPWSDTIARLAKRSGASVVPLRFAGHNGVAFQLAGLVHPRLRTAMLPKEVVNKNHARLRVAVGHPIRKRDADALSDATELNAVMRARCDLLAFRWSRTKKKPPPPLPSITVPPLPEEGRKQIEACLAREIIAERGDLALTVATHDEISSVMPHIGALREQAYRAVGEGSGKDLDLDEYDKHYQHLLLWDRGQQRLGGAYRLGFSEDILPNIGKRGLYTASLFDFSPDFFKRLGPVVELGRSFLSSDYQRKPATLMLLWRGIVQNIARHHPEYRWILGPVSIPPDHTRPSMRVIAKYLEQPHVKSPFATEVKARTKLKKGVPLRPLPKIDRLATSAEELDNRIQEIDPMGRGVPVLMRQYLKIGARHLAFNVDPEFHDTVDSLMLVDGPNIERRMRSLIFGPYEAAYCRRHGVEVEQKDRA